MKQPDSKESIIEGFKLYYEDLERKKVKTTPTKKKESKATKKPVATTRKPLKQVFEAKVKVVRSKLDNVLLKIKHPSKKAKKLTKVEREALIQQRKNGILGIGLLLVIVSIAYSTYIVRTFVNTDLSLLALAPQVLFALYILLKAFSKLYK